jgi:hypothetical protein
LATTGRTMLPRTRNKGLFVLNPTRNSRTITNHYHLSLL